MKVLFITRPSVFSGPGGDTVQLLKTAEYLKELGVDVTVADHPMPDLGGYDLIHFFNLRNPQDLLINVRRVRRAGIPSVLSTIWGSYHEGDIHTRSGLQGFISRHLSEHQVEYLKALARCIINRRLDNAMIRYILAGHRCAQKEIVSSVDILLPNSSTELSRVREDMDAYGKAGVVVVNAVDPEVFDPRRIVVDNKYRHFEGCVLCAARVEGRKGQLELIRALKGSSYKLVIVGQASPHNRSYYDQCRREADDNVYFIPHVEHYELAQLYKLAKVHALVSWMETPGLSSLEAALMGCNLVITDRGDTQYYFEDYAVYVDPRDRNDIRRGIERAMQAPMNPKLSQHVLENFTWRHTAKNTVEGYKAALKMRTDPVMGSRNK